MKSLNYPNLIKFIATAALVLGAFFAGRRCQGDPTTSGPNQIGRRAAVPELKLETSGLRLIDGGVVAPPMPSLRIEDLRPGRLSPVQDADDQAGEPAQN